jgi:hypothetical protein
MAKRVKTPKATLRLFTQRVNRLSPHEPQGFTAADVSHAPVRSTREEAYQDYLDVYFVEG